MTAPEVAGSQSDPTGLVPDGQQTPVGGSRVGAGQRSPLAVVLWTLGSVPAAAMALLLSMAVRVRLADGAWPIRNEPDPKELGFHNTATIVVILVSFASVVVVPLLTIVLARSKSRRLPIGPLLLNLVGFILLVVILRADVGGLGNWIGD